MTRNLTASAVLVALVVLSASAAFAGTTYDEFTGRRVTMMDEQVAIVGFGQSLVDPDNRTAYLKLGKIEKDGEPTLYALSVFVSGKRFLFQEQVFVKADEKVFDVEAKTKDRDVVSGGITESSLYPVSAEQLREMAGANSLKIRVRGDRGLMESEIKPKGMKKLQEWVQANVD